MTTEEIIFLWSAQQEPPVIQVANLYLFFSGKWWFGLFYTDTTVLYPYERVGCFNDKNNSRALPKLIKNYLVNETDLANSLASIIQACATKVYEDGFWYFGVGYHHECWSGENGDKTYNRHGPSDNCSWNYGVGSDLTILVYRFVEG